MVVRKYGSSSVSTVGCNRVHVHGQMYVHIQMSTLCTYVAFVKGLASLSAMSEVRLNRSIRFDSIHTVTGSRPCLRDGIIDIVAS